MNNAKDQFIQSIAASGITPPETLIADGNLHRYSSNGKHGDTSGWYLFFDDEIAAGSFGCWRLGINQTWKADIQREYTLEEKAAFKKRMEEARAKSEAERSARQKDAQETATKIWDESTEASPDNAYLKRKGVQAYGIRQCSDNLIIPMREGKTLHSLQTILPDGTKRFQTGGRIQGCYLAIGSNNETEPLCIAEGYATGASIHEATGYPVCIAFHAGNLLLVSQKMRERFPNRKIIVCVDDDYQTKDKDGKLSNTGIIKATEAAQSIGAYLAIPDFGENRPDSTTNFNDLHQAKGLEAVRVCIESSKPPQDYSKIEEKEETLEDAVKRLSGLSGLQYAQVRKREAKKADIPPSMLDKLIREESRQNDSEDESIFPEIEPWEASVNGVELLNDISQTIQRFIVCQPETAYAATLWIAMTWLMDVVQVAPLAVITAPEKRCGKTQFLDIIGRMSCKPMPASSITPAALFRSIELWQPTLLIDEADAFLKDNEELRGLLNAGHTRTSAFTIRTVGDEHTPTRFNLWGAKAIAGIGKLADTIMDRAIILELRRKTDCERVDRIRHAEAGLFETLQRKLRRFAEDSSEEIGQARPTLPEELNDRAQDNWEPLLAIADCSGGQWPELARNAALTISGDKQATKSTGTELLEDIREVFDTKKINRIFTHKLVEALCEDSEKPWETYNRGKPITSRQLSRRLSEYGIVSKSIRIDYENKKGFEKNQFQETFSRYLDFSSLPPVSNVTTSQASIHAGLDVTIQNGTNSSDTRNVTLKPSVGAGCDVVTLEKGVFEKKIENVRGNIVEVTL